MKLRNPLRGRRIPWPGHAEGGEVTPLGLDEDELTLEWLRGLKPSEESSEHRVEVSGVFVVRPWSPHRVEVGITADGYSTFKFICSAPAGFPCRMECAERCGVWEDQFTECDCPKRDSGVCQLVDWANSGLQGPTELYAGVAAPLRSDAIHMEWDSEKPGAVWRYHGDPEPLREDWGVSAADAEDVPGYWFSALDHDDPQSLACDTVSRLGGRLWMRQATTWVEVKSPDA